MAGASNRLLTFVTLTTATFPAAPTGATASSIRARSGAIRRLVARRNWFTTALRAGVATLGAFVASAAQAKSTWRTVRLAAAAVKTIIAARALWLILAPVAINFTIVQGSSTATNKEIITIDTRSVRVDSWLANGILAEKAVSLNRRVNGVTTIVTIIERRNVISSGRGRNSSEESIDRGGGSSRPSSGHSRSSKVVATTVPTI